MGQSEDEAVFQHALELTRKYTAVLDQHLANRRFVVGECVSLADFDIAAPFSQMPERNYRMTNFQM
jgi:glutathione S-transferase